MLFISALSYNLPKFSRNVSWNSEAVTVVNSSVVKNNPTNLFLTTINKWYAVSDGYYQVISGIEAGMNPTTSPPGGYSIFIAGDGNLYTYDSNNNQVNMWSMNLTSSHPVMFIGSSCQDLFVDTNGALYCSLNDMHQVVLKSLNDPTNTLTIVAGTGCLGSASDRLYSPNGIFVDFNFTLYVADSSNNRIQRFGAGQMDATTIAGVGAPGTINLTYPTDIVLDGDGYVFIVDTLNHRIIGSGPDGFRCVAGCINGSGSEPNQLLNPRSMSFDSYGNIWVADTMNRRLQKFVLNTIYGSGKCRDNTIIHSVRLTFALLFRRYNSIDSDIN